MYRKFGRFLFILLLLLNCVGVMAQSRIITGRITDQSTGQPIAGVNVSIKGTATTVVSNAEGQFSITIPSPRSVLVISYVGMGTQEIEVGNKSNLAVSMSSTQKSMDEVVVIGYGTVKKRDLTGAVSSIKGDEILRTPTSNAVEAMQGRISGVDITRSSGVAGAGANILVRGTRSINGNNSPLYVIDGYQGGNISDLNPNDIESIDVLKDASSTAIYGAQGANGVIIVTTKKGTVGKTKVSYDGYYGVNGYTSFPKPRLGEDYIQLRREAYRTAGQWSSPADDRNIFPNAEEWNAVQAGQWVDWFDLLNRNGQQQSHTVSIKGGTEKTRSMLSLGYFREEGMLRRNDYSRYNVRFNIDHNLFKWAKAGVLSQIAYSNLNSRRDPLSVALSTVPLGVPYDSAGNVNLYPLGSNNKTVVSPLTDERGELIAKDNTIRTNIMANAYLELTPIADLTIRSNFGSTLNFSRRGVFNEATSLAQRNNAINSASMSSGLGRYFNWDNIVTYNKRITDHAFAVTGVVSYIQSESDNLSGSGDKQLLASQGFYNLGAAQQTTFNVNSGYTGWNNLSFAGRLNYNYNSKYLLTATYRADGASRLGIGHKWDYFPSVALGWNINQESFLSDVNWISNLKLRGSWGKAGNYGIDVYGTQSTIVPNVNMGFGDVPASMYQFNPTVGNRDLKWETSATTNVGLDFGILKNRITGTVEWYNTITSDILLLRSLPFSTGVTNVYQNIGETQNKGVELSLNTRNVARKEFSWNSTVTFTKNHEEITKLIGNQDMIFGATPETQSLIKGRPIQSFYSYQKLGVWQLKDADLAAKYKFGNTPYKPGDLRVADINGDSVITTADRTYLGSAVPDFVLGFQNSFKYKGFDLGVFLFWRYGQMMNAEFLSRYNPSGEGSGPANLDYWTPENPTNDFPRPKMGQRYIDIPAYYALQFIDGSYFKVKNVTLGYTFPKSISGKIGADNIRLYATGNNIFTKAKSPLAKDYDPERGGAESSPLSRQFVFGVNLGF